MPTDPRVPPGLPGPGNLFAVGTVEFEEEQVTDLAAVAGSRVQRIVSRGQASPPGFWYDQDQAEWVAVLSGAALVRFETEDRARRLGPGDHLLIPAHHRHRVEWTAPDQPTIWLAVFMSAAGASPSDEDCCIAT